MFGFMDKEFARFQLEPLESRIDWQKTDTFYLHAPHSSVLAVTVRQPRTRARPRISVAEANRAWRAYERQLSRRRDSSIL